MSKFRITYERRANRRKELVRLKRSRRYRMAMLIETWVNNPDIPMKALGPLYDFSEGAAGKIISDHWLTRYIENPVIIIKQSKMNSADFDAAD